MSTSYTSLLGFALPTSGELDGSWGDVVNASITELVEDSIAGSVTASVASADWTLSTTGSGAVNQARAAILIPTGTSVSARNIFAPNLSKAYIVHNQSNVAVTVKGSTGPTTGATITAGTAALVAWNGSDFVIVAQDLTNSTGTLPALKGGTGQTSYTNGQLLIGNTSGNTLAKATLTAGTGIAITNGAGSVTIASTIATGVTSVSGTGTVNGITLSGTVTSTGNLTLGGALSNVNLSSQVTGTLPVTSGGTGVTSAGSSGNVLTSNGTSWVSSTPATQVYPGAGIAVSTGSAWTTSKASPSGTIVGTTDTQTLTNKRNTPRVVTTTSTATPSIDSDAADMYGLTAQAANITSVTVTGTPTDGQVLWIYIVGTAARAISWGASFEASTVALPTTTVSTNRLDVGFVWNAATSKWRCVASA